MIRNSLKRHAYIASIVLGIGFGSASYFSTPLPETQVEEIEKGGMSMDHASHPFYEYHRTLLDVEQRILLTAIPLPKKRESNIPHLSNNVFLDYLNPSNPHPLSLRNQEMEDSIRESMKDLRTELNRRYKQDSHLLKKIQKLSFEQVWNKGIVKEKQDSLASYRRQSVQAQIISLNDPLLLRAQEHLNTYHKFLLSKERVAMLPILEKDFLMEARDKKTRSALNGIAWGVTLGAINMYAINATTVGVLGVLYGNRSHHHLPELPQLPQLP